MRFLQITCVILFAACISGCFGGPETVEAPAMDPDVMADGAMQLCDENGDGFISKSEMKASPSIKAAKGELDTDNDGKISRDELHARFKLYVEMATGLTTPSIYVRKGSVNGIGLVGATVKMVPEPFMEQFIETATGTVIDPENGYTDISAVAGLPGVRLGFYRIEITSDDVDLPAKYNTETIYGVEIPPVTTNVGPMVIVVKK